MNFRSGSTYCRIIMKWKPCGNTHFDSFPSPNPTSIMKPDSVVSLSDGHSPQLSIFNIFPFPPPPQNFIFCRVHQKTPHTHRLLCPPPHSAQSAVPPSQNPRDLFISFREKEEHQCFRAKTIAKNADWLAELLCYGQLDWLAGCGLWSCFVVWLVSTWCRKRAMWYHTQADWWKSRHAQ